jgi:hypothetical protein
MDTVINRLNFAAASRRCRVFPPDFGRGRSGRASARATSVLGSDRHTRFQPVSGTSDGAAPSLTAAQACKPDRSYMRHTLQPIAQLNRLVADRLAEE